MNYMTCTTCKRAVAHNFTGSCLSCQTGFNGVDGPDVYSIQKEIDALKHQEKLLKHKLKEKNK